MTSVNYERPRYIRMSHMPHVLTVFLGGVKAPKNRAGLQCRLRLRIRDHGQLGGVPRPSRRPGSVTIVQALLSPRKLRSNSEPKSSKRSKWCP